MGEREETVEVTSVSNIVSFSGLLVLTVSRIVLSVMIYWYSRVVSLYQ